MNNAVNVTQALGLAVMWFWEFMENEGGECTEGTSKMDGVANVG